MEDKRDTRAQIRDFLATRRGKLTTDDVGLPPGVGRRRVPGLRREEVAMLAGVSTDWYTKLEKGHITGVSDDVLEAVVRALRLDESERLYLLDLARAARPAGRSPRGSRSAKAVPERMQWMLDSMHGSAAFVANGRLDVVAVNSLGRALYSPMFSSPVVTTGQPQANIARFQFLDAAAKDFFPDWDGAANVTVALLRAEAGRDPHDAALRGLVGELSTVSEEFRGRWAAHDVRLHHAGHKQFDHPDVGRIEVAYHSVDVSERRDLTLVLTAYTAEPNTDSDDRLKLLASLAATSAAASTASAAASTGPAEN